MDPSLHRHFRVWIAASITAILSWLFVPRSTIDHAAFAAITPYITNLPLTIAGNGSQQLPWQLINGHTIDLPKSSTPIVATLTDDLDGYFQSSPHSPIDIAVVFSNMQRLNVEHLASATVLAWDSPDPIGLKSLEKRIDSFSSVVVSAPLSRGSTMESLPPAFRRASIPIDKIQGDPSLLPIVNRVSMPGVVFGKTNTLAGFQVLDSEPHTENPPLLARWDDQVVMAFPLLAALQRFGITPDQIQIQIGKGIELGGTGAIIPIDNYGRLATPTDTTTKQLVIPAEQFIDGDEALFQKQPHQSVLFCDQRSNIDEASKRFNQSAPLTVASIISILPDSARQSFPRLKVGKEIAILLSLAWAFAMIALLPQWQRITAQFTIALICICGQFVVTVSLHHWLPGIPMLMTTFVAFILSLERIQFPKKPGALPIIETTSDRLDYNRYSGPSDQTKNESTAN